MKLIECGRFNALTINAKDMKSISMKIVNTKEKIQAKIEGGQIFVPSS